MIPIHFHESLTKSSLRTGHKWTSFRKKAKKVLYTGITVNNFKIKAKNAVPFKKKF